MRMKDEHNDISTTNVGSYSTVISNGIKQVMSLNMGENTMKNVEVKAIERKHINACAKILCSV